MTYFETILDLQTGKTTTREFDAEEIKAVEKQKAENQKIASEKAIQEQNKATEKAALLVKLGITDDEAKLLLS